MGNPKLRELRRRKQKEGKGVPVTGYKGKCKEHLVNERNRRVGSKAKIENGQMESLNLAKGNLRLAMLIPAKPEPALHLLEDYSQTSLVGIPSSPACSATAEDILVFHLSMRLASCTLMHTPS